MAGPFSVVAVLLAVAGAVKLGDPRPASAALATAGLPSSRRAVRALGAAEIALAAAALALGGPVPAALVAFGYLGFAGFVGRSIRSGRGAACGCFGRSDAPMTWHHLVYNLAAAGAAVAAAATDVAPLTTTMVEQPAGGLPFLMLVAVSTYLSLLVLTALPAARQAAAPQSGRRVRTFAVARRP